MYIKGELFLWKSLVRNNELLLPPGTTVIPNPAPGLEKCKTLTSGTPHQEQVCILSPAAEIYGIEIKSQLKADSADCTCDMDRRMPKLCLQGRACHLN